MIRKLISPLTKSITPTLGLLNIPTMQKSQAKIIEDLNSVLKNQIQHQESQSPDLSIFTNFFENQGWTVNYNDVQIELSKKQGPYSLKVITNAKTPISEPEEEEENVNANQQQDMGQNDFHEINVYIKRDGSENWLCANFLHEKGYSQLGTINFIEDYEKERSARQRNLPGSKSYAGPDLMSLQQKFSQSILQFVDDVGVNSEVMGRVYELSVSYEQKFYLEWLKDLRSVL